MANIFKKKKFWTKKRKKKAIETIIGLLLIVVSLAAPRYWAEYQTGQAKETSAGQTYIVDSTWSDKSAGNAITFPPDASLPSAYGGEYNYFSCEDVPEYIGAPYAVINHGIPFFGDDDITTEPFEIYSELDEFGRCGVAYANICNEIMPPEKRGDISEVKPSGWNNSPYNFVDGGYVYNRCHLIGFQLAGENDNERNLITGTRYMNVDGMLPFENIIADYVHETGNHVLLRVTPVYEGGELVARGVLMEAYSVEDEGTGVCLNVFCYNVQPGVEIDYFTGENWAA